MAGAQDDPLLGGAAALHEALAAALGPMLAKAHSARDFSRRLKLDKSLGWQLWRIATTPDPTAVLRALPGPRGCEYMQLALRLAGVDEPRLHAIAEALERLATLANEAGTPLRRLHTLVDLDGATGIDDGHDIRARGLRAEHAAAGMAERRALLIRKNAFKALSALRGVSMQLKVGALFVLPGAGLGAAGNGHVGGGHGDGGAGHGSDDIDLVGAQLQFGIAVTADTGPLTMYSPLASWEAGSIPSHLVKPDAVAGAVPWLVPNCSAPGVDALDIVVTLPTGSFGRRKGPGEVTPEEFERHSRIRPTATLSIRRPPRGPFWLAFSESIPGSGYVYRRQADDFGRLGVAVGLPTRMVVLDVFVHRSLPAIDATAAYVQHSTTHPILNPNVGVSHQEQSDAPLTCPRSISLPRAVADANAAYRALVHHALTETGQDLLRFKHYRAVAHYPVPLGSLVADWPLPERAAEPRSGPGYR